MRPFIKSVMMLRNSLMMVLRNSLIIR